MADYTLFMVQRRTLGSMSMTFSSSTGSTYVVLTKINILIFVIASIVEATWCKNYDGAGGWVRRYGKSRDHNELKVYVGCGMWERGSGSDVAVPTSRLCT